MALALSINVLAYIVESDRNFMRSRHSLQQYITTNGLRPKPVSLDSDRLGFSTKITKSTIYPTDKRRREPIRNFFRRYDCDMKHLKQPIARRANVEDDCLGHFFEQRFYSGALLTEEALIAAMAYVDLNPIRAELAERIEAIEHTSIAERLQENSAEALAAYLRPVVSGLDAFEVDREASWSPEGGREVTSDEGASAPHISASIATATEPHADDDVRVEEHATAPAIAEETGSSDSQTARLPKHRPDAKPRHRRRPLPAITLAEYIEVVRRMAEAETRPRVEPANHITVWMARTKSLRKRQRAYGTQESLQQWSADRGLQLREVPLPA